MTEWEKEREKEEFSRAAKLYKPLSTMMASRFTSAKYTDDLDTAEMPADPQVCHPSSLIYILLLV